MQAGSSLTALFANEMDTSLTMGEFIPWLRSITKLPIMLKVVGGRLATAVKRKCGQGAKTRKGAEGLLRWGRGYCIEVAGAG